MKSLQTKITLTYLFLAGVGVAAVGVLSSVGIEASFQDHLVDQLTSQANVLRLMVRDEPSATLVEVDTHVKGFARLSNLRVTLIDTDGMVVVDSDVPVEKLSSVESHLHRPEIEEAARTGIGMDKRRSTTVGRDLLYVALKTKGLSLHKISRDVAYIRLSIDLTEVQKSISEIRMRILIAGLTVLLVVAGVSVFTSRRISQPMVDIARKVEEIRSGNLDVHLEVSSNDEIGQLGRAINDLVDKLKADIRKVEKLERVRSEFLGNISHELRTPIFSLQGFLETLLDGAVDDPAVNRDFLQKAHFHASRLNTLLTELIDISQIESGEMKMSFRYFQLGDFLQPVVRDFQSIAEQHQVRLTFRTPDGDDTEVLGDRERLRIVLNNLVENAIRYNNPGGEVIVSYRVEDGTARIEVSDTGIGIAEQHLPRIFERFYRVDNVRSRESGGTGLGLAIVKHIIEAHGSRVEVISRIGQGTAFSFSLRK